MSIAYAIRSTPREAWAAVNVRYFLEDFDVRWPLSNWKLVQQLLQPWKKFTRILLSHTFLPRDALNAKRGIAIISRPSICHVDVPWAYVWISSRFMRIFAEVPWRGGVKRQWGNRKRQFSGFWDATSSVTCRKWAKSAPSIWVCRCPGLVRFVVGVRHRRSLLYRPLSPFHWPQNTWMNDHFVQFSILTITNRVWAIRLHIYRRSLLICTLVVNVNCRRTLNRKEQMRHRAVSLRQQGFLVFELGARTGQTDGLTGGQYA